MSGPRPRPGILGIDAYVGGESETTPHPALRRPIRLASNEGALGPSPKAMAAYRALEPDLFRYPDGASAALRAGLADLHGLDAGRIVCGAGSDELIALLVRAYAGPGDEVLHSAHGFLMYALSAKSVGATPVAVPERHLKTDVDAMLAAVTPRTRIVFVANPNNPTGSFLNRDEVARLAAGLPDDVLLVLDAAYAEYIDRDDYAPGDEFVTPGGRVATLRTFSKIYGLSALRLGWGYFPAEVADVLNRIRGPFNVGAPSQVAGEAALDDQDFIAASREHNAEWRDWTAARLAALRLTVHPSIANFLLVDFTGRNDRDAEGTRRYLKENGILVRQMGGYGLPNCLRVGIGTGEEMRAVVDTFATHLDGRS